MVGTLPWGLVLILCLGVVIPLEGLSSLKAIMSLEAFSFMGGSYAPKSFSQLGDNYFPGGNFCHGGSHAFQSPYSHASSYMGGSYGPSSLNTQLPLDQNSFSNTQLSFWEMLELLHLSILIDESILHNIAWLTIPMKIPLEIPKFGDNL